MRFGFGSTPSLIISIQARPASSCVAGPPQLSLAPCLAMPSKRCAVKWNSSFVLPSPGIVATTTFIGASYSAAFTIGVHLHLLVPLEPAEQIESHAQRQDEAPRRPLRSASAPRVDAAPSHLIGTIDRLAGAR